MISRSNIRQTLKQTPKVVGIMRQYTVGSSDGSTGSHRGLGSEDSFTKKEKAQENYYIKQHEKEQLLKLKEQLKKHKDEVENIEKQIDHIEK
ncbi:ATPase inhibitor, mitochondrial [Monosporozyma servazzii]